MQEKQYSEVASNAKAPMKLIGLQAKIKIRAGELGALGRRFKSCHPYS